MVECCHSADGENGWKADFNSSDCGATAISLLQFVCSRELLAEHDRINAPPSRPPLQLHEDIHGLPDIMSHIVAA